MVLVALRTALLITLYVALLEREWHALANERRQTSDRSILINHAYRQSRNEI